jgi:hypothetical protein
VQVDGVRVAHQDTAETSEEFVDGFLVVLLRIPKQHASLGSNDGEEVAVATFGTCLRE